jgi:hypothetical protein
MRFFLLVISHCGVCKSLKTRDDDATLGKKKSGAAKGKSQIATMVNAAPLFCLTCKRRHPERSEGTFDMLRSRHSQNSEESPAH